MSDQIKAYDSAYPGSMFERPDGGFVERDDAQSLANALLALIKSGDDASQGLIEQVVDLTFQRDKLLEALTALLDVTYEPPDKNCSCHISPPCNDCIDNGPVREAIAAAKHIISEVAAAA